MRDGVEESGVITLIRLLRQTLLISKQVGGQVHQVMEGQGRDYTDNRRALRHLQLAGRGSIEVVERGDWLEY